ncbi:hypothetical protein WR25_22261 [Diploscapter pachys]|uniref:Saccharopine dehydrogenase NADP binding domain-containing protein n=1 Tax=Diploscapter pachys TaxID=2018661 RepID=A0A2A2LGI1_9BILA|nr:hypothetical protein WR25_22261 [Diploscapter pachys]
MSLRRIDLVIYGATGFTGSRFLEFILKRDIFKNLSIGIAGRNKNKLEELRQHLADFTAKDMSDLLIIVANNDDQKSLEEMAKQSKILVNAVGPYRLYGEQVVKACVENGADHIDVAGEPAFLEKIEAKYSEIAKKNGLFVIGATGMDSLPADLGIHYMRQKFDGDLNHVDAVLSIKYGPQGYSFSAATYQTLIMGIQHAEELKDYRKIIMPNRLPKSEVTNEKRRLISWFEDEDVKGWVIPFLGADKSIVTRSQYYDVMKRGLRPVQFEVNLKTQGLHWAIATVVWMFCFSILARNNVTRRYLKKYPQVASFNLFKESGPTPEQMANTFLTYHFIGYGYSNRKLPSEKHKGQPDKKMKMIITAPDAYNSTSICLSATILAMTRDRDKMPKEFYLSSIFSLTKSVFIWPARESPLLLSLLLAFPVPFPVCALIRSSREPSLSLSSFSLSRPGLISVRPSGDSPSFAFSSISPSRLR